VSHPHFWAIKFGRQIFSSSCFRLVPAWPDRYIHNSAAREVFARDWRDGAVVALDQNQRELQQKRRYFFLNPLFPFLKPAPLDSKSAAHLEII
jgi:hypothetical protein